MADTLMTTTREAFHDEARRRFGDNPAQWAFVCPSCAHVATVQDWRDAGAPDGAIAFSCVGRWTGAGEAATFKGAGGPCNYAGGGLFGLNPVTLSDLFDDFNRPLSLFALAPAPGGGDG